MICGVADTHTIIWYLFGDKRLSPSARNFIETASQRGDQIGFSAITLAEIVYLIESGRIPAETFNRTVATLETTRSVLIEILFDQQVARQMFNVDRSQIPELPDRIIAATALYLNVPVISRDRKIQASSLTTIW